MFSLYALKIKNTEHDTIKNSTLKLPNNSVLYLGKFALRQKEEEREEKVEGGR